MKYITNIMMLVMMIFMILAVVGFFMASFVYGWIMLVAAIIPCGIIVGIIQYFTTDEDSNDTKGGK